LHWFGENRIQGFLGVAFGMYFSELTVSVDPVYDEASGGSLTSGTAANFRLGIPPGLSISISDSIMLNANYTLNWLWDNPFLDNNLIHAVGVGVGFTFGS
jgi:hypothetical protein